jgi:hypothetical protein
MLAVMTNSNNQPPKRPSLNTISAPLSGEDRQEIAKFVDEILESVWSILLIIDPRRGHEPLDKSGK